MENEALRDIHLMREHDIPIIDFELRSMVKLLYE